MARARSDEQGEIGPGESAIRSQRPLAVGFAEGNSDDCSSLTRTPGDRDMTKHQLSGRQFNTCREGPPATYLAPLECCVAILRHKALDETGVEGGVR
jgi:hypothetical protein